MSSGYRGGPGASGSSCGQGDRRGGPNHGQHGKSDPEKSSDLDFSIQCGFCDGYAHKIKDCPVLERVGEKITEENDDPWTDEERMTMMFKCPLCKGCGHNMYECPIFKKSERDAKEHDRQCRQAEQRATRNRK